MKTGRKITYKTFFNIKKAEAGYDAYDMQRLLHQKTGHAVSLDKTYGYLSGRLLPTGDITEALSEIFDVPLEEALSHVIEDHNNYQKNPKLKKDAKKASKTKAERKKAIEESINAYKESCSSNDFVEAAYPPPVSHPDTFVASNVDTDIFVGIKKALNEVDNDHLKVGLENRKMEIYREVLACQIMDTLTKAVFDETPDETKRAALLLKLQYQINCTLYMLHGYQHRNSRYIRVRKDEDDE